MATTVCRVRNVEDFAAVARRFCAFVETADALDRNSLVRQLERHLVALYGAALMLPDGETRMLKRLTR